MSLVAREGQEKNVTESSSRSAADPATRPEDAPTGAHVGFGGVCKTFTRRSGDTVRALDDVSIDIAPGSFLVLLGPSGCGKTTLLRCLAGLEEPESGVIEVDGEPVFSAADDIAVPTEQRHLGMVFQGYAVWPHMTAFDNVAYPLKVRKARRSDIERRVTEALTLVGIPELRDQYPAHMSGGQQQRIALARAVVSNSRLVLFDEPLSNVDAKIREQLRVEILRMQQDLGFTAIYVTHDQTEAMALASDLAVVVDGRIQQLGHPEDVYRNPVNRYVASFVGSANMHEGEVVRHDGVEFDVRLPFGQIAARLEGPAHDLGGEPRLTVVSRPEHWTLAPAGATSADDGANRFAGVVTRASFLGSYWEYDVEVEGGSLLVWISGRRAFDRGAPVVASIASDDVRVLRD